MADFKSNSNLNPSTLAIMGKTMKHRGVDNSGIYLGKNVLMHQNTLNINEKNKIPQPHTLMFENKKYTVSFDGELYNRNSLKNILEKNGVCIESACDCELCLWAYIFYGDKCVQMLKGTFAFVIYVEINQRVFMARDVFGIKPLYYAFLGTTLIGASEIKAILAHGAIKAKVDKPGLWRLFFDFPSLKNSRTVFRDIYELPGGETISFDISGFKSERYWNLKPEKTEECPEAVVYKTKELTKKAISDAMGDDESVCTILTSGLDSLALNGMASKITREKYVYLDSFSGDFESDNQNFAGDECIKMLTDCAEFFALNNSIIKISSQNIREKLFDSVEITGFPGNGYTDASLLCFSSILKRRHNIVLSGYGGKEIFGSAQYINNSNSSENIFIPGIDNPFSKIELFESSVTLPVDGGEYIKQKLKEYKESIFILSDDDERMKQSRIAFNMMLDFIVKPFVGRYEKLTGALSLNVRMPFLNCDLVHYLYNIDNMEKSENGDAKSLLKKAVSDYVPSYVISKKESSYFRMLNNETQKGLSELLEKELSKKGSLFCETVNRKKTDDLIGKLRRQVSGADSKDTNLMLWLLQTAYWFEKYNVILI